MKPAELQESLKGFLRDGQSKVVVAGPIEECGKKAKVLVIDTTTGQKQEFDTWLEAIEDSKQ